VLSTAAFFSNYIHLYTNLVHGFYICTGHKKGISSCQLARDIGVTQKSAWFMLHRVREMMKMKNSKKLNNTVEADETYIGGKVTNMHKAKRKELGIKKCLIHTMKKVV